MIRGYSIDNLSLLIIIKTNAGVVKLVDAEDSKSSGPRVRVGSIPTSGTNTINKSREDNFSLSSLP